MGARERELDRLKWFFIITLGFISIAYEIVEEIVFRKPFGIHTVFELLFYGTITFLLLQWTFSRIKSQRASLMELKRLSEDIVNNVDMAIHVVDRRMRIIGWNRAMVTYSGGLKSEATLGENLYAVIPSLREIGLDKAYEKVFATGEPFSSIYRTVPMGERGDTGTALASALVVQSIKAAAKTRYVDTRLAPVVGTDGRVEKVITVLYDITKEREMEQEISTTKEYLESLINSMNEGLAVINRDYVVTDVNPVICRMLGLPREEIIGRLCHEIFHASQEVCRWPEVPCSVKGVFEDGRPSTALHIHTGKDGKRAYVEVNASPLRDKEGRIVQAIQIYHDVTERVELQNKVSETRDFLNNVIESSPDSIITADLEGKIMSFSRGAEEILGYRAEEVIGRSVEDLYPPEVAEERRAWIARLLEGKGIRNQRARWAGKDGRERDINLSISLLRDKEGLAIGTVGIAKDITKEVQAEERLREAYEQLKELDAMKDEFLATVSHELCTPLTAILGSIELFNDDTKNLTPEQKEFISILGTESRRLNDLIGNLLDVARSEDKMSKLKEQTFLDFSLNDLIEEVLLEVRPLAERQRVVVERALEPLPRVLGEREELKRVLTNLLGNAIKFNNPGGKIFLEGMCRNGFIEVSVRDTGIGIGKEDIKRIFTKFYRVDTGTTRRHGGTGLGLAISKKIIQAHGGDIWAESEPGKGSKFTFVLPVTREGGKRVHG